MKPIPIQGIVSGYHLCCVKWFDLRSSIENSTIYRLLLTKNPQVQHIQCPFHRLFDRNPRYMTCERCGWHQLDRWDGECQRCETILMLDIPIIINESHFEEYEAWQQYVENCDFD